MKNTELKSVNIRLSAGDTIPVEMHKIRMVQETYLWPVERRAAAMAEAGYNTFLLKTKDIFLDMLTDSGTNAMSDKQIAAMMVSDDAYAGSQSFTKLEATIKKAFNQDLILPVHQGRAAEHIISQVFVKPGMVVPMNYHFTTTRAHIELAGGEILELYGDDALQTTSDDPFKGNIDLQKLERIIEEYGADKIAYIRMEASTNLIGGQPYSMSNYRAVKEVASKHGLMLVLDASLIGENAYFIKKREPGYENATIQSICHEMVGLADITYLSTRKSGSSRGGLILTNSKEIFEQMRDLVPLFEGFLTYGGMSTKEIEAMAVGLDEMLNEDVAGASPNMVEFLVKMLDKEGVPVITPAGALGCHIDSMKFIPHVPQNQYPAGALAAAYFIVSGTRGMERGTISTDRAQSGEEIMADVELLRLAIPRRAFTASQMMFVADRLKWLLEHRDLVGGLRFTEEPPVLRFFLGRLEPVSDWPEKLVEAFRKDFGEI